MPEATPQLVGLVVIGCIVVIALAIVAMILVHAFRKGNVATEITSLRARADALEAKARGAANTPIWAAQGPTKDAWLPGALTQVPRNWRSAGLVIATLLLLAVIAYFYRQQVGIIIYKACLIT